jgi:class 3 adenylate cyclase
MDYSLTHHDSELIDCFHREHQSRMLVFVLTDLAGSAALKQELGDQSALALQQLHEAMLAEALAESPDAARIGRAGDGFLFVFPNPSQAVRFALRAQALHRRHRERQPQFPHFRVGIHLGTAVVDVTPAAQAGGGAIQDVRGLQVDLAARLCALAAADQILCTRAVFDDARHVLHGVEIKDAGPLTWLVHGPYVLKGREDRMEVCEVGEAGLAPLTSPRFSTPARPTRAAPTLSWNWLYAPALVELGDKVAYEELRRVEIARYLPSTSRTYAERVAKHALLLPADDRMMEALGSMYNLMARAPSASSNAWNQLSLALVDYRRADFAMAAMWSERALSSRASEEMVKAEAGILFAMAKFQMGQQTEAQSALNTARVFIESALAREAPYFRGQLAGYEVYTHLDMVYARVLIREATALFEGKKPPGPLQHEMGKKIAEAKALTLDGKFDEAEPSWDAVGPAIVRPDVIYARFLRNRISKAALTSHWTEVSRRCETLMKVNAADTSTTRVTDFLQYGAVLLEQGDVTGYARLRRETVSHFGPTDDIPTAELLCRGCLVTPVASEDLGSIGALYNTLVWGERSLTLAPDLRAWYRLSLAAVDYRRGDYANAIVWSQRCLEAPAQKAACTAPAHILGAMAMHQLKRDSDARGELAQGRQALLGPVQTGTWYDRLFANALLREATALIEGAPAATPAAK